MTDLPRRAWRQQSPRWHSRFAHETGNLPDRTARLKRCRQALNKFQQPRESGDADAKAEPPRTYMTGRVDTTGFEDLRQGARRSPADSRPRLGRDAKKRAPLSRNSRSSSSNRSWKMRPGRFDLNASWSRRCRGPAQRQRSVSRKRKGKPVQPGPRSGATSADLLFLASSSDAGRSAIASHTGRNSISLSRGGASLQYVLFIFLFCSLSIAHSAALCERWKNPAEYSGSCGERPNVLAFPRCEIWGKSRGRYRIFTEIRNLWEFGRSPENGSTSRAACR